MDPTFAPTRRHFLKNVSLALGAAQLSSLAACASASSTEPESLTPGGNTLGGGTSSGSSTSVPDATFVRIPANSSFVFVTNQSNANGGEASPVAADYCLSKYLVTNAQWAQFIAASPRTVPHHWSNGTYPMGKADHPLLWVSLADAEAYCAWLTSKASGWTFRIPTEAEWENAARGATNSAYPWGSTQDTAYVSGALATRYNYNGVCAAWYLANQPDALATFNEPTSSSYGKKVAIRSLLSVTNTGSVSGWIDHDTLTGFVYTDVYDALVANGGFTTAVGAYPLGVSPTGCHDMAGNAFEWTSSLITASNGAEAGASVNAVRGGSWYSTGTSGKATYRGEGRTRTGGYHSVGFRVAASPR